MKGEDHRILLILITSIITTIGVFVLPEMALAYAGPGGVVTGIGTLLAVIAAVFAAIFGFVWYPIKRLIKNYKGDNPDETGESEASEKLSPQ